MKIAQSQPELSGKSGATFPNSTLKSAWIRQRIYSQNASTTQRRFVMFRAWIIGLSVLATILSVSYEQIKLHKQWLFEQAVDVELLLSVVHFAVLLTPITVSILVAGAVRFDRGNNWILLRGSAEALKREIYYYRTRIGAYQVGRDRDAELARKLKLISERLKGTPVNLASFHPHETDPKIVQDVDPDQHPERFTDLTHPKDYLTQRLEPQFDWYRRNAKTLDRQLQRFEWATYILGGVGTLFAATTMEAWVAVSGALTAALTSFLEFKRVEATLIGYNQAADSLYDIRTLWLSLPQQERKLELLVKATEEIIQSENASWLQDMQDRLADLYSQTKPEKEPESSQPELHQSESHQSESHQSELPQSELPQP